MKPTLIIFGASGFIGTHMVRVLAAQESYHLIAVDLVAPREILSNVEYRIGDVRDLSTFDVEGQVDTIVNLAAVHKTPGHPGFAYYETNVLGAVELAALARRKKARSIIFTSSISVYGPGEQTKSETSPLEPISAYGWSKMMAERIFSAWQKEDETNRRLVICRPAVIFGHGEGGNFCRLAKLMKKGIFIYPGRADTIKACFYVKDLIHTLFYALNRPEHHVLFNGCYGKRHTIKEIVETFRATYFPKVKTFLLPRWCVLLAASLLRPFSVMGLGIHPDRVMKLVQSTDIQPDWLVSQGLATDSGLREALIDWHKDSGGRFN